MLTGATQQLRPWIAGAGPETYGRREASAGGRTRRIHRLFPGARLIARCALAGALAAGAGMWPGPAAFASEQSGAARRPAAVTNAVEVRGDGRLTTLSFTISGPVEARAFVMERPDRAIVELPDVNFQLPQGAGRKGHGLASSFRYGVFAPGRSRIVIDLAAPALVTRAAMVEQEGALPRFEIELTRVERAQFHQEAAQAAAQGIGQTPPPAPAPVADAEDQRPLIVLDPGHGGVDNGAISSAGLVEKDIVLAFARRLKEHLDTTGRYRTMMTRDDDRFVPLGDRVRLAQQNRAALFLSIHADILRESPQVRGATIYTGAKFATDSEAAQLAAKENEADSAAGLTTEAPDDEVSNILLDLTMRETRIFSRDLAAKLVAGLSPVIRMNKNPHRSARFIVLTAPDTPSALLEIGYLSSTRDADLMNSPEWRDRTTAALTTAINRFFETRKSMAPAAPQRSATAGQ